MDEVILYSMEQIRSFDFISLETDALTALAYLTQDEHGVTTTVVSGFAGTPTAPASLTVNLAAGRIYQLAPLNATSVGAIPQDLTSVMQQGFGAAQAVVLSTAGIAGGQSRWSLIECQFSQVDDIPATDPTGGVLLYYNSADPTQPFQGPNNSGTPQPTRRKGLVVVQVINGAAAATGSEVPPQPTSGWTPLFLIDLSFGQTQINSGQILPAGPSVGTGVPSNYPYRPLLAGLLNSHHNGNPGQAPLIHLDAEVTNLLGFGNMQPIGFQQGRLSVVDTTHVKLAPYAGNLITIGGVIRTIPAAGVEVDNTGVAVNTLYYVYATMGVTDPTIFLSTTGWAVDPTSGLPGKSDNTGQPLIGMVRTNAASHFIDSATQRFCLNWHNRNMLATLNAIGAASTSSGSPIELDSAHRCEFLSWADESLFFGATGWGSTNNAGSTISMSVGIDSTTVPSGAGGEHTSAAGGQVGSVPALDAKLVTEGYHFVTILGSTDGGTANFTSNVWAQTRG